MTSSRQLVILTAAALLWHCSDRERQNPLDPENVRTGGKPTSLSLRPTKHLVSLRWEKMDNSSITGYSVWRKAEGETEFMVRHVTDSNMAEASDTVSDYDVRYTYAVSVLTTTWETPLSDPESIIAGPFNFWIADYYGISLSRLSYDGAHMLMEDFSYFPIAVAFDTRTGDVWLANYYPPELIRLTTDGKVVNRYPLDRPPVDVALNPFSTEVIVAQSESRELFRLIPATGQEMRTDTGMPLTRNSRMAVNRYTRQIWLTVPDSSTVLLVDTKSPGKVRKFNGLDRPFAVAAFGEEGLACVGTDSGLLIMDGDGVRERLFESSAIVDMDFHEDSGEVWAITFDEADTEWEIQVVSKADGIWTARTFETAPYRHLSRIAVNPGTEHRGIMLYEGEEHSLVRLDGQGREMGRYHGFSSRVDIGVEQ